MTFLCARYVCLLTERWQVAVADSSNKGRIWAAAEWKDSNQIAPRQNDNSKQQ